MALVHRFFVNTPYYFAELLTMNIRQLPWAILYLLLLTAPCAALNLAADAVNAEFMWQQGYTGAGVEISVIDLHQADSNHSAINGNYLGSVNFAKGAGWLAQHATAVTGAALSQDATRRGIAHGAGWWTGQTTNRAGIAPNQDAMTVSVETFAQGLGILNGNPAEVITMSIGVGGSDTATDQWSLALDHVVATEGAMVVVAAGNDGPSSNSFPGPPGTAYNILSVGATGGTGAATTEDYSQVAPYSSRGYTIDGRSKPDIVAPGSLIETTTVGGGWVVASGTSFAAPIVAGGAALLIDMGADTGMDTDPKVIKSVLLNSADKLPGWSHSATHPLDPNLGAGQMDLEAAFHQYAAGQQSPGTVDAIGWNHGWVSGSVADLYSVGSTVPAGVDLTATLVWNRMVTTNVEDIESAIYTPVALENLDLFLYDTSNPQTPVASSISTVDNVEHLFLSIPTAGQYTLEVRAANGALVDPLSYSLAWHVDVPILVENADFDASGFVDGQDFLIWQRGMGLGATLAEGDANDDHVVDELDLAIWESQYGSPEVLLASIVPEPCAFSLIVCSWALLLRPTQRCYRRIRR